MRQRYRNATDATTTTRKGGAVRTRCEQLHLRNYDEDRTYRQTVSVSRAEEPPEHEATYELAPGETESELEIIPPERYEVHVSGSFRPAPGEHPNGTAGSDTAASSCNVGDRAPQTIVLECGNGIVSVSEGLAGEATPDRDRTDTESGADRIDGTETVPGEQLTE